MECYSRDVTDRLIALANQVYELQRLIESRLPPAGRCPKTPSGERCALEAGHQGSCKWERGD